jgi:hypothetical protein
LTSNSKPFHIRALAIPRNKAANFVVWDNIVAPLNKLRPYFNNGLGILDIVTIVSKTSDSLCVRAPVLCLDVSKTSDSLCVRAPVLCLAY